MKKTTTKIFAVYKVTGEWIHSFRTLKGAEMFVRRQIKPELFIIKEFDL
jgi:hypothetical protein